jgi:hypothetical protein
MILILSSILDFRGLYFCAAYLPANNLRRISTIYLRGYWKGSENGRVVTIGFEVRGGWFFFYIGGTTDHHCLKFLFLITIS